ncbi:MAG: helix-turn-helix transcriptional regulator [Gordonibacter sp.]|uniref:helix-turn-helix domain-containing protein n=1 Tax=Gordonibacter sp. TaxID=1968902 RepID=UPI002FC7B83C
MNVEIAQRLAARRKQAGLSQEALAEQLGVSRQAVSKWERSESSPDTDNLIALAQLYGLSLDELLYVEDEMRDDVAFEAADRAAERWSTQGDSSTNCAREGSASSEDAASRDESSDAGDVNEGGADSKASKVRIGLGGIHVLDGDDYVHVSWRDGVHVKDAKKGDEVHVDWNGVHVTESVRGEDRGSVWEEDRWYRPCGYSVNGERFDTMDDARAKYGPEVGATIPVRKHYLREFEKSWVKFPYPLVVIVVYLLLGILNGAWGVGLFLFLTIPVYYMVGHAVGRRRIAPLISGAYPIAVVAWFCYMAFILNQPHPAWVAFLTIPLVEWLVHSLSRWWRGRKRAKEAAKVAPIDVDAQ